MIASIVPFNFKVFLAADFITMLRKKISTRKVHLDLVCDMVRDIMVCDRHTPFLEVEN
jgi:hypothetical protein